MENIAFAMCVPSRSSLKHGAHKPYKGEQIYLNGKLSLARGKSFEKNSNRRS